ncbi:sensor histidine kinase [Flindersiella endophytica]
MHLRRALDALRVLDRQLLLDTAIAALLTVVSLLALGVRTRAEQIPDPGVWAVVLILAINLPLAFRRRYPTWLNLAVGALSALYGASPFPDLVTPVPLGGVLALYTLVAWSSRVFSVAVGVLTAISVLVVALLPQTNSDVVDFSFTSMLLASAWVLGDSARVRRAYAAEQARNAVAAERARIARDLHDVIAHHVTMMVVQAEAGPLSVEREPARAAGTFDRIGDIGRQALADMRRMLGVLRDDDETPEPLRPQPGVLDLPELIEQVRGTGVPVSYTVAGDPVELDPGADVSAYRIVQEALTNAMKHAEGAQVRVTLEYGRAELRIDVHNDDSAAIPSAAGRGYGLTGMGERARLFGGDLSAGPDPSGGFTVSARLPIGDAR